MFIMENLENIGKYKEYNHLYSYSSLKINHLIWYLNM